MMPTIFFFVVRVRPIQARVPNDFRGSNLQNKFFFGSGCVFLNALGVTPREERAPRSRVCLLDGKQLTERRHAVPSPYL